MSEPTIEVTTIDNEILRHQTIADLMRQFAKLVDDAQIFTPTTMAVMHAQAAWRLQALRNNLNNAVK